MQIDPFYVTLAVLFFAGLLVAGLHELDERRWKRQREAEEGAGQTAE